MQEEINAATGIAKAYLLEADARRKAYSLRFLHFFGNRKAKWKYFIYLHSGSDAANLKVAELSIDAFGKLAKQNNTVLLPADGHPASSFIAQVLNNPLPPIIPQ